MRWLMDWDLIFSNALYAAISLNAIVLRVIAASASTSTSATPGLLNFGQAGFAAVGAYAFAIGITYYGWLRSAWPDRRGPALIVLALLLGLRPCACAPTTWPSSPSPRPRSSASS